MKNWVVYAEGSPSEIMYSSGKIILQNGKSGILCSYIFLP